MKSCLLILLHFIFQLNWKEMNWNEKKNIMFTREYLWNYNQVIIDNESFMPTKLHWVLNMEVIRQETIFFSFFFEKNENEIFEIKKKKNNINLYPICINPFEYFINLYCIINRTLPLLYCCCATLFRQIPVKSVHALITKHDLIKSKSN